jgi:hypothetical protein
MAAVQIAAAVSEATSTKLTRSVAAMSRGTVQSAAKPVPKNQEGDKKLGFISKEEWNKFSHAKRAKIREERDKKGLPGGNRPSHEKGGKSTYKERNAKRNVSKTLTESEERVVNAIGSHINKAVTSNVSMSSDITDPPPTHDAGNAFGGQKDVQRKKQS